MTSPKSLQGTLLLACVGLAQPLFAQLDAGIVGKRLVLGTVFAEHVSDYDVGTGWGGGFQAQFPVNPNIDLVLNGSYERFSDVRLTDKRGSASLVFHQERQNFRPFFDLLLGGTSQSIKSGPISTSESDGIYGAGIGLETPIAPATALYGRVGYTRYFDNDNGDYWTIGVGVNHWFDEKLGLLGSITAIEDESVIYSLGILLRF